MTKTFRLSPYLQYPHLALQESRSRTRLTQEIESEQSYQDLFVNPVRALLSLARLFRLL